MLERVPFFEEGGGAREVVGLAFGDETFRGARVVEDRGRAGRDGDGQRREATVHDHGSERDPGAVLDRERGVDDLADRRLLGAASRASPGSVPGQR